ncbi:MAG: histidinol dehydrogenase, partial [Deltaproteobacteria bacterium]|nr:histidinol dehydrogenase [Deltaproteobacteria bacterium]
MGAKFLKKAKPVLEEDVKTLRQSVEDILERVRKEGDEALAFYSKTFDKFEGAIRVSEEEAGSAKDELPEDIIKGLDFAIERVTAFAEAQMAQLSEFEQEMIPGVHMGHRLVPVDSCAAYVPAGRYPCLTSAVMSLVPAKVAGYCLGGAQAIAAMAYGTETIQPVDFIVGPGNQYVMEAKRQVFGTAGIDFLAGPSECMVIADETGRADYIAADLLAQCEHDPMSRGALVTTSESLGQELLKEIERQLGDITTEDVARPSWEDKGDVVVVETLEEACAWANEYAPEHLEVHSKDPK